MSKSKQPLNPHVAPTLADLLAGERGERVIRSACLPRCPGCGTVHRPHQVRIGKFIRCISCRVHFFTDLDTESCYPWTTSLDGPSYTCTPLSLLGGPHQ